MQRSSSKFSYLGSVDRLAAILRVVALIPGPLPRAADVIASQKGKFHARRWRPVFAEHDLIPDLAGTLR